MWKINIYFSFWTNRIWEAVSFLFRLKGKKSDDCHHVWSCVCVLVCVCVCVRKETCPGSWKRKMRRCRLRRLRHPTELQAAGISTLEITFPSVSVCVRVCVCACVCVCVCVGPDFRERTLYKVKCDLCGAVVPRQVEKDPETWEVRDSKRKKCGFTESLVCVEDSLISWTLNWTHHWEI